MIRGNRFRAVVASVVAVCALTACAPDVWRGRPATGFNLYLDRITIACKPLVIGNRDLGDALVKGGFYDNDYNYFFDLTSQLYYGRISRDAYRVGITAFLGPGAETARSLDCIVTNLPADRPTPSGGPAIKLTAAPGQAPTLRSVRSSINSIAAVAPQM